MKLQVSSLLVFASLNILYTHATDRFTLRQRLHDLAEYKRSISRAGSSNFNSVYSRSTLQVAQSIKKTLFKEIIQERSSVDIVILLDGSDNMGTSGFRTAKRFLARLINLMPADKFDDGSIKVAMLTYGYSRDISLVFNYTWPNGYVPSRDYVRKAIKRTEFLGSDENHGASALLWADARFKASERAQNNNTAKVLLYATNGRIDDTDLFPTVGINSVAYVSGLLKNEGYKTFTVVPGTNVERSLINDIASTPKADHIIPVVNTPAGEDIAFQLRTLLRNSS